jgi:hypothetical protein
MKYLSFLVLLIIAQIANAEINFDFQTNHKFIQEPVSVPEFFKVLTSEENPEIKLIVGNIANDKLFKVAKFSSDELMKTTFLKTAEELDLMSNQSHRQLISFKKTNINDKITVFTSYTMTKDSQLWIENNNYEFSPHATTISTLTFPSTLSAETKEDLLKNFIKIRFSDVENKIVLQNVLNKIKYMTFRLAPYLIANAQATEVDTNSCTPKGLKSERAPYTLDKKISLYNLSVVDDAITAEEKKLSELEAQNKKADYSKVQCLAQVFKNKKEELVHNLVQYDNEAPEEQCITNSGANADKISIKNNSPKCKEISSIYGQLKSFENHHKADSNGNFPEAGPCANASHASPEPYEGLVPAVGGAQKAFCCDPKDGPLFEIIKKDNPSTAPASTLQNKCSQKYSAQSSLAGNFSISSCAGGVIDGAKKMIVDAKDSLISVLSSLVDDKTPGEKLTEQDKKESLSLMERLKATWNFATELPQLMSTFVSSLGEGLAKNFFALNNCMTSQDRTEYICSMIPETALMFLGPGMIFKFLKVLKKISAVQKLGVATSEMTTAMSDLIAEGIAQSGSAQGIIRAGKKLKTGIAGTTIAKRSSAAMKKVAAILFVDVGATAKELLKKESLLIKQQRLSASERAASIMSNNNSKELNQALATIKRDGRLDLNLAGDLNDADRLKLAEVLTGRSFSPAEKELILGAHNVDGKGIGEYTALQLREKAKILAGTASDDVYKGLGLSPEEILKIRSNPISKEQREMLMRNGICGKSPSEIVATTPSTFLAEAKGNFHNNLGNTGLQQDKQEILWQEMLKRRTGTSTNTSMAPLEERLKAQGFTPEEAKLATACRESINQGRKCSLSLAPQKPTTEPQVTIVEQRPTPVASAVPRQEDSVTKFLNVDQAQRKKVAEEMMKDLQKRGTPISVPALQDEGRVVYKIKADIDRINDTLKTVRTGSDDAKKLLKEKDLLEVRKDFIKRRCQGMIEIATAATYEGSNLVFDLKRYSKTSGCEEP